MFGKGTRDMRRNRMAASWIGVVVALLLIGGAVWLYPNIPVGMFGFGIGLGRDLAVGAVAALAVFIGWRF